MLSRPLIEIQSQVLRQDIALVGVPFGLHYRSDRVPGRVAAYALSIPLSGLAAVPKSLTRIRLEVAIARRVFTESFPPARAQTHVFRWNGSNGDGRSSPGAQRAAIRVGYTHHVWRLPEFTYWKKWTAAVGTWDACAYGLGGWTLSVHHFYDHVRRILYLGDGSRRGNLSTDHRSSDGYPGGELLVPAEDGAEVYVFDRTGRHLRTVDMLTGALRYRFDYDTAGRLNAIEDGQRNLTRIERDSKGNATAIAAPYGQRAIIGLNPDGYLATVTAAEAMVCMHGPDGLLMGVRHPNGGEYRFRYDEGGRLTRWEDPAGGGGALARVQDATGTTVALLSAEGCESRYRTERLPGGGQRQVNQCCGGGEIVVVSGPEGGQEIRYPDGTVVVQDELEHPRGERRAPVLTRLRVSTPGGVRMAVGLERRMEPASRGDLLNLTALTDTLRVNDQTYTSTFERTRQRIVSRTPAGRQGAFTLDTHGRITEVEILGLLSFHYTYDERGRLTEFRQGPEAGGRRFTIRYDDSSWVSAITDPVNRTVRFSYDAAGRLERQILPDGSAIVCTYDSNGNRTSIMPPGRSAHWFAYTPLNQWKDYRPPEPEEQADTTGFAYNLDKQPTRITRPDGKTLELEYDAGGRTEAVTSLDGQMRVAYDPETHHLRSVTTPNGVALSFAYDGFLPTEARWSGPIHGSVRVAYDNLCRAVSQRVNDEPAVEYRRDADGLIVGAGMLAVVWDSNNGLLQSTGLGKLMTSSKYNAYGERESFAAAFDGKELFAVKYTRDGMGRIIELAETIEGQSETRAYRYDLAGRLSEVTKNGQPVAQYEYDANGNRVVSKGLTGTRVAAYDAQDRLRRYGDVSYTYTANGELASRMADGKTTRFEHDGFGNLKGVVLPGGTRIEYLIDAQNRRIGKKVNGALVQGFLYEDQLRPAVLLDGQNRVVARFVYATRINVPDYMEREGKTDQIVTDHLGSPRLVVDSATGEIVQRIDYDEFGDALQDTNPGFQPFGFAGGLYERETGLTRFGARDYDAFAGRWTVKDPLGFGGRGTNLYVYACGDPINMTDSTGLQGGFLGGYNPLGVATSGSNGGIGISPGPHLVPPPPSGLPGTQSPPSPPGTDPAPLVPRPDPIRPPLHFRKFRLPCAPIQWSPNYQWDPGRQTYVDPSGQSVNPFPAAGGPVYGVQVGVRF